MALEATARVRLVALLLALGAVATAVAFGAYVRSIDPSNPVMAAEDPYTHMQLVREHLRDGEVEPSSAESALYPPGFHGLLSAWWSFTGAPLYDLVRFGPVVLGAIGLVGLAALVGPREGGLAAFAAALAMAAMPEEVARTTMASPTAVDLALLPFLVAALLEIARGRLAWLGVALPIVAFLLAAHPWVLLVVALGGLGFLALALGFPWSRARGPPLADRGLAAVVALLGGALLVAASTRWEASGTGFGELATPLASHLPLLPLLLVAGLAGAAAIAASWLWVRRGGDPGVVVARPRWLRPAWGIAGAAALALLVASVVSTALAQGLPEFVDLPRMVGWPVLVLATIGLLLLPLAGSPVGMAGGGLFLATLPFVLHNPLESPFWPHRTVAFLGLGAAILVGVAARRLADAGGLALNMAVRLRARRPVRAHPGARAFALLAPALVVGVAVGGAVLAETPAPYAGGWYRLYNECEFANLRAVADLLNQDERAVLIVGAWQPQLVLSAFTNEVHRLWTKPEFFRVGKDREAYVQDERIHHKPVYVLVERHLFENEPRPDLAGLEQPPFAKIKEDCRGQGVVGTRFALYHRPEGGG